MKYQHNWNIQTELFQYVGMSGAKIPWGYRYFCTKCLKTKEVENEKD